MNKVALVIILGLIGGYAAYATYDIVVTRDSSDITTVTKENAETDSDDTQTDIHDDDTSTEVGTDISNTNPVNKEIVVEKPDVSKVMDRLALARTLTTQTACEAKGGAWSKSFSLTMYCKLPTSDTGNSCTDSSQCESWCQAPNNTLGGTNVTGYCFGYTSAACSQEVENGVAGWEQCQMAPLPTE